MKMSQASSYNDENDPSRPILSGTTGNQDFTSIRTSLPEPRSMQQATRENLVGGSEGADVRLNVLRNSQEQAVSNANLKCYAYVISFTNISQVVATFVMLTLSLKNEEYCKDAPLDIWAIVQSFRLLASVYIAWGLRFESLRNNGVVTEHGRWLHRIKGPIDNFGLVWLVIGNIWMFAAEDKCVDTAPLLFSLCSALIYIGFIAIFLPCIMVLLMLPFVCFCLPCVIRLLANITDASHSQRGASKTDIEKLETVKYVPGMYSNQSEEQCSICLNNYKEDETLRKLPCDSRHHFHAECVDEWLLLNATCPICRARVIGEESQESQDRGADSTARVQDTSLEDNVNLV